MAVPDPLFPAKRTLSPGGDFTIRQFFLPIQLNGEEIWALLDTGAHISILPKEVAGNVLSHSNQPTDSGMYPLARIIGVPYQSYELDVKIFDHIDGTIQELDIHPYVNGAEISAELRNVEFQVPQMTWPEIADCLEADSPLSVEGEELDYVILGLYGVLDELSVSFVGGNSVRVGPIHPE